MMKRLAVLTLGLVSACAVPARNTAYTDFQPTGPAPEVADTLRAGPEAPPSESVACNIRETRTPNGMRIEAVVHADRAIAGAYDFTITAYSSGGSSDITQGGPLDLAAGDHAMVGTAEIPAGRYRATLTLSDAAGDLCHLERSA